MKPESIGSDTYQLWHNSGNPKHLRKRNPWNKYFELSTWNIKIIIYVHICCFNFDDLAKGNAYNLQQNSEIVMDHMGIELTIFRLRQHRQLPVVQHVHSTLQRPAKNTALIVGLRRHWTNDNLSEMNN